VGLHEATADKYFLGFQNLRIAESSAYMRLMAIVVE
jgi:hypothetical protein